MAVSNPEEERNRAFGVFPSVAVPGERLRPVWGRPRWCKS
jgi:hypothetical protein